MKALRSWLARLADRFRGVPETASAPSDSIGDHQAADDFLSILGGEDY